MTTTATIAGAHHVRITGHTAPTLDQGAGAAFDFQATLAASEAADDEHAAQEQPDAAQTEATEEPREAPAPDASTVVPQGAAPVPAPTTIRSLNERLLREGGGTPRREPAPQSPGAGNDVKGVSGAQALNRDTGAGEETQAASTGGEPHAAAKSRGGHDGPSAPARPEAPRSEDAAGATTAAPSTESKPTAASASPSASPGRAHEWQQAMARLMGPVAGREVVPTRVQGAGSVGTPGAGGVGGVGAAPAGRTTGTQGVRVPQGAVVGRSVTTGAEAFDAQLAKGVAAALERGKGTLTLRLKPEALGEVQLRMTMKEGALTARFEVRTEGARDLLVNSAAELHRSLEAAGINVERIETTIAPAPEATTQSHAEHPEARAGERHAGDHQRRGHERSPGETRVPGAPADDEGPQVEWLVLGLDTIA